MSLILSVCKPNKLGLMDLAKSLVWYGNTLDSNNRYFILEGFLYFISISINAIKKKETVICIFWDNSLYSLMYLVLSRLFLFKTIYYYHEPGGYSHKRQLRASISYSLFASVGDKIFLTLTQFIGISKVDNINSGDFFLPLLYANERPLHLKYTKKIGYLGNLKGERLPNVLKRIEIQLNTLGYEVIYFPSIKYGRSTSDKYSFLSQCAAIWNVYAYPYNLSAVTGDAFMSNTPLIVSKYEPFLQVLSNNNLAILLDPYLSDIDLVKLIDESIKKNEESSPSSSLIHDQSKFGGGAAFHEHWRECFERIYLQKNNR